MDERRMQRRVGWVVLFTITFLGILLVINNPAASPFRTGGYEIYIDLDRAPGVAVIVVGQTRCDVAADRDALDAVDATGTQLQFICVVGDDGGIGVAGEQRHNPVPQGASLGEKIGHL